MAATLATSKPRNAFRNASRFPNTTDQLSPTSNTGAGDTWQNRVFSVAANGDLSYTGNIPAETPHLFDSDNNKIQVSPKKEVY